MHLKNTLESGLDHYFVMPADPMKRIALLVQFRGS
jgi:hypothetical protein